MANTETVYTCGSCDRMIIEPEDGLVVRGTIQPAKHSFSDGKVTIDDLTPIALCVNCFLSEYLPDHTVTTKRNFHN